jgi:hypothetical protein
MTITLERLHNRGYMAMLAVYEEIAPHLNPADAGLYTRPERIPKLRECERFSLLVNYWRGSLLDVCPA